VLDNNQAFLYVIMEIKPMQRKKTMHNQNCTSLRQQRIAAFIALSADYIGVKPPSNTTVNRWTAQCACQQEKIEARLS
jgi:hypothetical protein